MWAAIQAIEYYLPDEVLSNEQLESLSEEWTAEKIQASSGIISRRIAGANQCASDLAVEAGRRLFESRACAPDEVDFLLLCTQSPDYFLPTLACIVQDRLGLKNSVGALDINLGCSGFVYGLGLAKGLIETGQATNVLLITADTISRYLREDDLATRILFGDGAAATLISAVETAKQDAPPIGNFIYGSDGAGANHLIVHAGAARALAEANSMSLTRQDPDDGTVSMTMNGPEVFSFTLREVPKLVSRVAEASGISFDQVRWFVFHQANRFILEHLRKKLEIPDDRFCTAMSHCGNTISSTIPIALKEIMVKGELSLNDRVLIVGFGVGLSWAGTTLRWTA
jgi:3-oxoacyl-[acyl-carrier-protein] synthase III